VSRAGPAPPPPTVAPAGPGPTRAPPTPDPRCPAPQNGLGVSHGVDLAKLLEASDIAREAVGGRALPSRAGAAMRVVRERGSDGLRELVLGRAA